MLQRGIFSEIVISCKETQLFLNPNNFNIYTSIGIFIYKIKISEKKFYSNTRNDKRAT